MTPPKFGSRSTQLDPSYHSKTKKPVWSLVTVKLLNAYPETADWAEIELKEGVPPPPPPADKRPVPGLYVYCVDDKRPLCALMK